MQPFIWDRRPDGLRAPAMVCAFQGWNDAGDAASSAVSFLAESLDARRFAKIDSEEFYDFQANRPCVRFGENEKREISWPSVEVFEAPAPRAQRDLVLVQGVEPSMRWRSFSSQIPVLMERLGIQPSTYEGPTGIVGVLHHACAEEGLPSVSLWAAVPHYVAAATNPKAALALLRKVEPLIGVSVDVSELESAAADYERQVELAVQSDPDIQAFVERLELAAQGDEDAAENVPSGDILASEFQRFLRQRGREGK